MHRARVVQVGQRGTGAAQNCREAASGVEIVAVADLFERQVTAAKTKLKLPDAHGYWGFDAYQKVLASDVDLVILATPPGFRPMHFEAAIAAGKHVFMEKPVAVDPVGCRSVIATAQLAKQKRLAVVAGTQRRQARCPRGTIPRYRGSGYPRYLLCDTKSSICCKRPQQAGGRYPRG